MDLKLSWEGEGGEEGRKLSEAYAEIIGRNLNMDIIIPSIRLHKSRSFFERPNINRQTNTTTRSFVNWWRSFSLKRNENWFQSSIKIIISEPLTLSFFFCSLLTTMGLAWRGIVWILAHTSRRSLPTESYEHRTGIAVDLSPAAHWVGLRRCRCGTSTDVSWSTPSIRQILRVCLVL